MVVVTGLMVLVAVALVVLAHGYVWRRLVRDVGAPGGLWRRVGTVGVVLMPLLSLGALVSERSGAPFGWQKVLAWPGFLWLAVLLYLLLALLVGEVVRPLLRRFLARSEQHRAHEPVRQEARGDAQTPDGAHAVQEPPAVREPHEAPGPQAAAPAAATPRGAAPPLSPSRRLFVSRIVGGAAATAALATVGYGTYGVLRGPRVKRVTIALAGLPRSAHGFRIAVVSDIHLGPILGRAHTQRVVDTINSTRPDLVAVVGDLVDGSVEDLASAAEPLNQLEAPHGSFFVTGNHEYYSGADAWVAHVRELGLHPLENERVEIAGFDLAGVNDVGGESQGEGPDFEKALGDRDRSRTSVLLAHQPILIDDAVRQGVDLQLSGHTHGGQLWPGNYIAALANPTVAGLERYGDTQLYVSRGAGAWGPPVRVDAPSDITVVQLASLRA